ncbi:hypothetical protein GOP47_0012570 [Adiantum capillus-veneris]|uniref:Uncharacterized protein n=1 Tax=Adiantum capillus-veneris TaxID=13818 RepID=A0A9D4URD9_ADICA|nr:hypothetical protein GOP47_0012570 [Adiantum capillus-veneris]
MLPASSLEEQGLFVLIGFLWLVLLHKELEVLAEIALRFLQNSNVFKEKKAGLCSCYCTAATLRVALTCRAEVATAVGRVRTQGCLWVGSD